MKDTEVDKLNEFTVFGKCFIPTTQEAVEYCEVLGDEFIESEYCLVPLNQNAIETSENAVVGQILSFTECTERDLKFHKCFMSLLGYIWSYLPDNFKAAVPKKWFYLFLKHLKKNYNIVYSFKDEDKRLEMVEYLKANKKKFRLTYLSIYQIAMELGKTELIEYESIAFGRMSEMRFREYVREWMPLIYSGVIGRFYDGDTYNSIIENIETDYEKFFAKLNSK
jgi:hypothetical protein